MKKNKVRKLLSVLLAIMMMASCFAYTASAASLLETFSDSFSQALVTATANPTPETPLTYSYTMSFYAKDLYGRPSQRSTNVEFYLSEDDYKKGAQPLYIRGTQPNAQGKAGVEIHDVFVEKPPATLYFVIQPQPDTIYTPMSGTVYAQYAG